MVVRESRACLSRYKEHSATSAVAEGHKRGLLLARRPGAQQHHARYVAAGRVSGLHVLLLQGLCGESHPARLALLTLTALLTASYCCSVTYSLQGSMPSAEPVQQGSHRGLSAPAGSHAPSERSRASGQLHAFLHLTNTPCGPEVLSKDRSGEQNESHSACCAFQSTAHASGEHCAPAASSLPRPFLTSLGSTVRVFSDPAISDHHHQPRCK